MVEATKFPSTTERERISTLRSYQKLYENEQLAVLGLHELIKKQYKKVADLVYLSHAIPARVSEFYGDFVAGDIENMIIAAGNDSTDDEQFVTDIVYNNDLKEKIFDYAVNQSEFGFTVLIGRLDEEQNYIIEEVGQDQYFPQKDGSIVFATYKKDPADPSEKRLLLYTQHYRLDNGKVVIERQAWTTNDDGVAQDAYSLESMAKIMGKETIEVTTTLDNLDELPIRQVDNGKKTKWGFGKSDYVDIFPQLAEVNERSTQISTQLLKNLDAKLVVPSDALDEEGKLKEGDTFGLADKEQVIPQFVTNTNTMLTDANTHITNQLKFISFTTGVPMFELLRSAMPERVEALRMELFSAVRKTHRKRAKLARAIMDMIRIGFKMSGKTFDQDPTVKFGDVIPTDDNIQANTESVKVTAGLSSRVSAIMRLENIDREAAEKELEDINNESTMAGAVDTTQPPVIVAEPAPVV